jgi:hypothetical protein
MAAALPLESRSVIDHDQESLYLAWIAELEEEVRTLKAELAARDAAAIVAAEQQPGGSSFLVVADGTQGMRRGVSAGQPRSVPGSPGPGAGSARRHRDRAAGDRDSAAGTSSAGPRDDGASAAGSPR